jgi:hypothetical protein
MSWPAARLNLLLAGCACCQSVLSLSGLRARKHHHLCLATLMMMMMTEMMRLLGSIPHSG